MTHAATITAILSADPFRRRALEHVYSLNLPDCWIAAGFIRNAVWDHLHGRPAAPHTGDVDVIWFDHLRTSQSEDHAVETVLRQYEPAIDWSVKNQARMHIRNDDPPYASATDAMRNWPETATAIGVRQTGRGTFEIAAPFGTGDLFGLMLRPTPRFQAGKRQIHLDRIRTKRWLQTWPLLRIHPGQATRHLTIPHRDAIPILEQVLEPDVNDALPQEDTPLRSIDAVEHGLSEAGYIANRQISTAIYMAHHLQKPILVEGPAGVGKTELAKSVASWLRLPLIRMQCYEGLDESKALYEWKYGKQLLYTQILKDKINSVIGEADDLAAALAKLHSFGDVFFSHQFLEPRPLLRSLQEPGGAVLLIDEIDKSDQEFEAFLLEILSDYQVTIPEIGTVGAIVPPIVLLTSNSTRDLGDALKRRCLHLHIGFPDDKLEAKIIASRVPGIDVRLLKQLVSFAQQLRTLDLKKVPSVSETIDWAKIMLLLHTSVLEVDVVRDTLNVLLKFEADIEVANKQLAGLTHKARQDAGIP